MDNESITSRHRADERHRSSDRRHSEDRRDDARWHSPRGFYQTPWAYRVAAWTALILLFVAVGYYGTGVLFGSLSRRGVAPQQGVVQSTQQLQELLGGGDQSPGSVGTWRNLDVYVMNQDGTGLIRENRSVISDIQEVDAAQALKLLFAATPTDWTQGLEVRHLFRDGVTAYLDMPQAFLQGLETLEETPALMFITSIVRTMVENFQPIARIYFLVEGRWVDQAGTVPLSVPWELPQS